jgi:putative addiction module CopG family antidote
MEIRPTPDQETLIRAAIEAGRFESAEDAVKEALALWEERERAAALAELRASLDEAEAEADRGEYVEVTNFDQFAAELIDRFRLRLETKHNLKR